MFFMKNITQPKIMLNFRYLSFFSSSLSLFCYIYIIFLSFSLVKILPSEPEGIMLITYFFNFAGMIAGIILCPRIMPLPDKNRPLSGGIIFIFIVIAAQFIIRGFGVQRWIDSAPLRAALAVFSGITCTTSYGLFFLSFLRGNQKNSAVKTKSFNNIDPSENDDSGAENRTGKYCPFIFTIALTCGTIVNIQSVHALKDIDPLTASAILFGIIKWILPVLGVSLAATLFFLAKQAEPEIFVKADNIRQAVDNPSVIKNRTNWVLITRLLGLACVFTILNGVMEMQLFPLVTDSPFFRPNFIVRAIIIIILGFFAGNKINIFVAIYLVPGIVIFILMSCLPLLRDYSLFIAILSTLVTSYHHSSWAIFSTAVVENYYGGKHFYSAAVSIQLCGVFSFFSPFFSHFLHGSVEFTVLYSAIAAIIFVLLSFRVMFPALTIGKLKTQYVLFKNFISAREIIESKKPAPEVSPEDDLPRNGKISFNDFLYKHNLSKRETDVAKLMITEGLDTEEIAERLFISLPTVKTHITNIYKKFNVKKRGEFMALFVKLYPNVSSADI